MSQEHSLVERVERLLKPPDLTCPHHSSQSLCSHEAAVPRQQVAECSRLTSYRHLQGWRLIRKGSGRYQMKDRPHFAFTVSDLKKKKKNLPQNMSSCGHLLERRKAGPRGHGLQNGCFHWNQQRKPGALERGLRAGRGNSGMSGPHGTERVK